MYSTQSHSQEPLTLEKLKEAIKIIDDLPPAPFFIYSWAVPYDQVYYGEWIDKIAKQLFPGFNPAKQKAYLISKRWEKDINEMLTTSLSG